MATLVAVHCLAICPHDDAVTLFRLSAIHKFAAISSAVPWLLVEDSNSKALVNETVTLALKKFVVMALKIVFRNILMNITHLYATIMLRVVTACFE